jgi:ketosteroid isomerase-like protein
MALAKGDDATRTASEDVAAAFVQAFADGWRAPVDADSFADHFESWLHPDVQLVQSSIPTVSGRAAFREQFARPLFELVPDLHGTVERWCAHGDDVYIELRLAGRVGRQPVTLRSCDRVTLRDGRAIERVAHVDPTPLVRAVLRTPRVWPRVLRQRLRARGSR